VTLGQFNSEVDIDLLTPGIARMADSMLLAQEAQLHPVQLNVVVFIQLWCSWLKKKNEKSLSIG
jgi:hypothetical protein